MSNFRNIGKFKWLNDGIRSLNESIVYPEVEQALNDWKKYCNSDYILIGGLAYSYYCKPRPTQDIDLMFLSFGDIPESVMGFKRTRKHCFQHNKTHVEVEVLDSDYLNINPLLIEKTFEDSIESDGVRIASPKSLIALKLDRYNNRDIGDIDELLKYCLRVGNDLDLDFENYNLNKEQIEKLNNSISNLNLNESKDVNSFVLDIYSNKENFIIIEDNDNFKILLSKDKYSAPGFYYLNKINRVMRFDDFAFHIKIPNSIGEKLEVIESSSDFKSFTGYENREDDLHKWLRSNLDYLKKRLGEINI
jgi:hypothetical protein